MGKTETHTSVTHNASLAGLSVLTAKGPARQPNRHLVDHGLERFSACWRRLAYRTQFESPTFTHPVSMMLIARERSINTSLLADNFSPEPQRPIEHLSFDQALARFDRYCDIHLGRDIDQWRETNQAETDLPRSRPVH